MPVPVIDRNMAIAIACVVLLLIAGIAAWWSF